jgi:hypothetical protein
VSDTWVRRQGAELDDVFVLDEACVSIVAARGFEDDLNRSLGSFDLEIKLGWTLNHAETRYVRLPRHHRICRCSLHKDRTALPLIDKYALSENEWRRAAHIPMPVNSAGLD